MKSQLLPRIFTALACAAAAASAVYWTLQVSSQSAGAVNAAPASVATIAVNSSQVALALGAKPAPTEAENTANAQIAQTGRFQLMGVLAVGSKQGAALISIDGKPAKPYSVGVTVDEATGLKVKTVAARAVVLGGKDGGDFTLALPVKKP